MSEDRLPSELQLLIAAERESRAPAGARDEVAQRLAKTIGLPALAAGAAHAAQAAATATPGAMAGSEAANVAAGTVKSLIAKSLAAKLIVAVVIGGTSVGAVVGVGRVVHQHRRDVQNPTSRATVASSTRPATTTMAPPPSAPNPAVELPATAPPVSPTASHSEPHRLRHSDIAVERALVADARSLMQSGDTTRALAILKEHARRYPRGQLAEERDALEVVALARAGDHKRARVRADEFVRHHPNSLFLPSVQQAATEGIASP